MNLGLKCDTTQFASGLEKYVWKSHLAAQMCEMCTDFFFCFSYFKDRVEVSFPTQRQRPAQENRHTIA